MATTFYPALSSIVDLEVLPEQLSFVKDGAEDLLAKLFFKDLQYTKSPRGDAAHYSLKLVSFRRIDLTLPGSGFALVLNPSVGAPGDPAQFTSEFPITIDWEWPILAYLHAFRTEGFSFGSGAFYDLAVQVFNLPGDRLVEEALAVFFPARWRTPRSMFVDASQRPSGVRRPAAPGEHRQPGCRDRRRHHLGARADAGQGDLRGLRFRLRRRQRLARRGRAALRPGARRQRGRAPQEDPDSQDRGDAAALGGDRVPARRSGAARLRRQPGSRSGQEIAADLRHQRGQLPLQHRRRVWLQRRAGGDPDAVPDRQYRAQDRDREGQARPLPRQEHPRGRPRRPAARLRRRLRHQGDHHPAGLPQPGPRRLDRADLRREPAGRHRRHLGHARPPRHRPQRPDAGGGQGVARRRLRAGPIRLRPDLPAEPGHRLEHPRLPQGARLQGHRGQRRADQHRRPHRPQRRLQRGGLRGAGHPRAAHPGRARRDRQIGGGRADRRPLLPGGRRRARFRRAGPADRPVRARQARGPEAGHLGRRQIRVRRRQADPAAGDLAVDRPGQAFGDRDRLRLA